MGLNFKSPSVICPLTVHVLSVDIKSWDNREHLCRRVCLWKKLDVEDFSVEQPEEITESANAVISKKKYEH
jgi:hypothetical protein